MRMQPLAASQLIWLRWKESMKIQDEDRSLMIIIIIIPNHNNHNGIKYCNNNNCNHNYYNNDQREQNTNSLAYSKGLRRLTR